MRSWWESCWKRRKISSMRKLNNNKQNAPSVWQVLIILKLEFFNAITSFIEPVLTSTLKHTSSTERSQSNALWNLANILLLISMLSSILMLIYLRNSKNLASKTMWRIMMIVLLGVLLQAVTLFSNSIKSWFTINARHAVWNIVYLAKVKIMKEWHVLSIESTILWVKMMKNFLN